MIFITQKDTREKLTQNWIDSQLECFDSNDFQSNYGCMLLEDKWACIDRIKEIAKSEYDVYLSEEYAETIYEYLLTIEPNGTMNNWYVGYNCIDSVDFGEQEVQLPDDFLPVMDMIEKDFYISSCKKYAYYNLSGTGLTYKLTEDIIINSLLNNKED